MISLSPYIYIYIAKITKKQIYIIVPNSAAGIFSPQHLCLLLLCVNGWSRRSSSFLRSPLPFLLSTGWSRGFHPGSGHRFIYFFPKREPFSEPGFGFWDCSLQSLQIGHWAAGTSSPMSHSWLGMMGFAV